MSDPHGTVPHVRIYVAGPVANVRAVQAAAVAAGHELTLDWTRDISLTIDHASRLDMSAALAGEELDAIMTADAGWSSRLSTTAAACSSSSGRLSQERSAASPSTLSSWATSATKVSSTSTRWVQRVARVEDWRAVPHPDNWE